MATKINRNKVQKKKRVERFVLGNYSAREYGTRRNIDALKKDVEAVKTPQVRNNYQAGHVLVESGNFDIYQDDQRDRLKKFGYKVDNLTDSQIDKRYTQIIRRAIGDLIWQDNLNQKRKAKR